MKKPMIIMLCCLGILFGGIFAYKSFGTFMMHRFLASRVNVSTVSAMPAEYASWQPQQKYYGSVRALKGVNVTTESPGLVEKILFKDGSNVKKGDLLVQLNAETEIAGLHSLQANAALAATTLRRDTAQYAIRAISKATLDTDAANYKSLSAQAAQQETLVEKKSIRAPFSGRVGIRAVDPGQYVNVGNTVVPLEELDFIQVEFYAPQQELTELKVGQAANLTVDSLPKRIFKGKITAINPVVELDTRNVKVQVTVENPKYELTPGMFATINVETGNPKQFITLPQTAISYNPYGNIIYVLNYLDTDKKGVKEYRATQQFVMTGETRGDQVAILSGIKKGDLVVTSGQLKLTNNATVTIDNSTVPKNNPAPTPREE